MKRRLVVGLAVLIACWVVGENRASAQYQLGQYGPPQIRQRPAVSPFVTLGLGGVGGAADYYGLIQPQENAGRLIGQLQYGVNNLNNPVAPAGFLPQNQMNALGGLQTGHPATYFNTGHYYPPFPNGTVTPPGALAGVGPGGYGGYGGNAGQYGGQYGGALYGGQTGIGGQQFRPFFSGSFNNAFQR